MTQLARIWTDYWFRPASPFNLAICRIVFFGLLFERFGGYHDDAWHTLRDGGIWYPVGIFRWVPLFEPDILSLVMRSMGVFYLLAALGLFTRFSTIGAFLTTWYVFALRQNFGKYTGGGVEIALFVIGAFAASRAGDYLSLDRMVQVVRQRWPQLRLRRNRGWSYRQLSATVLHSSLVPPEPSGHYRWPLQFGWMMFFMLYFTAGLSKVTAHGLEWALSDNLRNLLIRHHYSHFPPTDLGLWIADRQWAYKALGLASLSVELLCPLGMLHWAARAFFVVSLASMQYGIYLTLGVSFSFVKLMVLLFVPWEMVFLVGRTQFARIRASLRPA